MGNQNYEKVGSEMGEGPHPSTHFLPLCCALHYRVIYWDTHRDRVVYVDPFDPRGESMEEEWKHRAIQLCEQMGGKWNAQKVSPPAYGMGLPALPVQVDGTSCGLDVNVYMLRLMYGWEAVTFPPEGTNTMRLVVARCLGKKSFPMKQLQITLGGTVADG